MSETLAIIGHTRHGTVGPHLRLPTGFTPLRLCVEMEGLRVEVTCAKAVLGRHSDSDLRIPHPEVSRRHCVFTFDRGQWSVRDLGSLNGIMLNGARAVEAAIYSGDRIRLGCVGILVESATPRLSENDKLRQIIEVLPS
jgi:FHA domain